MVNSHKRGGEFVQRGTYGCVFRPPLKCSNPSSGFFRRRSKVDLNAKFKTGYVSKLMTDANFNNEIYEVIAISNALKLQHADMAWQKKYLVLPLHEDGCVIDIKNKDNIKDIDDSNWPHPDPKKKRANCNFTVDDIMKKVKNYRVLNQVDGGVDLKKYLEQKGSMNDTMFHTFNTALIDLVVNGIYKLNNFGIYHFDIKTTNIVYNESEDQMRLIDWGFARYINKTQIITPDDYNVVLNQLQVPGTLYYGSSFGNALITHNFNKIQEETDWEALEAYDTSHLTQLDSYDKNGRMKQILKQNYKAIVAQNQLEYFKTVYLPNNDLFSVILMYREIYNYIESDVIRNKIDALIETYLLTDKYSKEAYNIIEVVGALYNLSDGIVPEEPLFPWSVDGDSPGKASGRTRKRTVKRKRKRKRKTKHKRHGRQRRGSRRGRASKKGRGLY